MTGPKYLNDERYALQIAYLSKDTTKKVSGVVFQDAFLRGIRDLGYKSPGWALCEEVDNALEAGAARVSIRFWTEPNSARPTNLDEIAIVDNGHGMIPEMIEKAVMWGGTERENSRSGFGRYGYGLPSSVVSFARVYTVYSKAAGEKWHRVHVDLKKLADAAGDDAKTAELLRARPTEIPKWIAEAEPELRSADTGTIVHVEKIDRFDRWGGWKKTDSFINKLLPLLGTVYRNHLSNFELFVDGRKVSPVDPLFLMEEAMYVDATPVRAQAVETVSFDLESPEGRKGTVRLRAAIIPPNFQHLDPEEYKRTIAPKEHRDRAKIMKQYNGLLICRNGRQIDCIQPRWTKFQNYDRNLRVEVDFDAELDEGIGITTSKQQIVLDDWIWDALENRGRLAKLIEEMRRGLAKMRAKMKMERAAAGVEEGPLASEVAMAKTSQFASPAPPQTAKEKTSRKKVVDLAAAKLAKETGKSLDEATAVVEQEAASEPYKIAFEATEEGPFYRPERLGEQKKVYLNTHHAFYSRVYEEGGPDVQSALQVLLLVLGEAELEHPEDTAARSFYRSERSRWSNRLHHALRELTPEASLEDAASATAERLAMEELAADEVGA